MTIDVRALSMPAEIAAAADVFDAVWNAPPRERLSREMFRAMTAHTNLLLGAFDADACVGVLTGWWGRDDDGTVWMWSARLGVRESHRRAGIATALKLAQARFAAERGVGEIRWTFDPMRARNAAFNLTTLGARAIAYIDDCYGPREDRFNAGERTDRLLVSWTPTPPGADPAAAPSSAPSTDAPATRITVPADLDAYLSLPPQDRRVERDRVRQQMRAAFASGMIAAGFRQPATYLMTKGSP